jgi:hypothetical protein
MKFAITITVLALLTITNLSFAAKEVPFTLEDRDRLIRVEEGLRAISQRIDGLEKRFDDISRQLDRQTMIFTALVVAVIGFAYWDRRTIIRKAKEETIAEIEREGRLKDMINDLRELAKTDSEVAKVLKQFNIL